MSNKRKNIEEGLLPGLESGGGYSPAKVIQPRVDEAKKGKFKRSGHLADQMLKYDYPTGKGPQLSIFDSLQETTKDKIKEVTGVEITEIAEGIKLSPSETKVIDSLCKLLHDRSQNLEPDKKDYYTGNSGSELVDYGGEKTPAPKLAFTLYELTMEYSQRKASIRGAG